MGEVRFVPMRRMAAPFAVAVVCLVGVSTSDAQCPGDCNGNDRVSVNELVLAINIGLGNESLDECRSVDGNNDEAVTIDELIRSIAAALQGCVGISPTPTATPGVSTATRTFPATSTTTPTVHRISRCGNGAVESPESCDDGDGSGGDGCAANCTNEVLRTFSLDSRLSTMIIQADQYSVPLSVVGSIRFTMGQERPDAVVGISPFGPKETPFTIRAGEMTIQPIAVPGVSCVCIRSSGTDGTGSLACGAGEGSVQAMVGVHVWFISDQGTCGRNVGDAQKGQDGLPCTDDDPGKGNPINLRITSGSASAEIDDIESGQFCGNSPCVTEGSGLAADCTLAGSTSVLRGSRLAFAVPIRSAAQFGSVVVTGSWLLK